MSPRLGWRKDVTLLLPTYNMQVLAQVPWSLLDYDTANNRSTGNPSCQSGEMNGDQKKPLHMGWS